MVKRLTFDFVKNGDRVFLTSTCSVCNTKTETELFGITDLLNPFQLGFNSKADVLKFTAEHEICSLKRNVN